jgi:glucan-binding YG repeat protein
MLKRITKITGLLVCAASVISIMPVMAADVKTIETQDGTIYSAAAKGGIIYINGEINDQDDAQYYVSNDGQYHKLDGIDSGLNVNDLINNKYLEFDDKDTYLDVTDNYKEVDNDARANAIDDVETTLRRKIKSDNDGRFSKSDYQGSAMQLLTSPTNDLLSSGSGLSVISYDLANVEPGINKSKSAIYTDYQGNYVDADYNIGSLKVSTTTGGSVTIKNTEDTYDVASTGYEYKATISETTDYKGYITETNGAIYRWANLAIYRKKKSDNTWTNVTSEVKFGGAGNLLDSDNFNADGSVTVLHKFTRTTPASDDIDGIKYAKDASIYFIADENGKSEYLLGRSHVDASGTKIYDATNSNSVGAATGGKTSLSFSVDGINSLYLDTANKKLYSEQLKLKSKEGFGYIDISDNKSIDTKMTSIATTGGRAWALSDGYLRAWDPSSESFTKLYKVDGSMDHILINNKDNFLLWNQDDKVYSLVNNTVNTSTTATTTATGAATATTATTTAAAGWIKAADGTWSYNKADGTKATGWFKDGSTWYYLNAAGVMQTGWINDNGTWYYLSTSGAMKNGWINDNGTWYYCDSSGAMLSNTTVDGYLLGANGAWIK